MNSDPIQDYILEDENKMRTAAAVFNAWPEVRKKLVSDFLDRLKRALQQKRELERWEFGSWGRPFTDSQAAFDFWKPTWKAEYSVSLRFDQHGEEVFFGVARDAAKERIKKCEPGPELLTAVKEHYTSAGATRWWEAWVSVQSLPADWTKAEVLWRMRDGNDEFVDKVAEQLVRVAQISERIVDRLAGAT